MAFATAVGRVARSVPEALSFLLFSLVIFKKVCIEAPMQKKEKSRLGFEPQKIRLLGRSTFRLSYWALLRVRLKRSLHTCILKF